MSVFSLFVRLSEDKYLMFERTEFVMIRGEEPLERRHPPGDKCCLLL